ncbi:hypothetical protein Dsin_028621 [Dipteronia sinensis]|uniref:MOSC domain-containing protein n=1 Tax=Dipteronia sinensis TaxID=43782 RepID=A0AAD9ZQX7_9ROSI|nr:hypothetical protein Dsin_028621 [Dipteronia sinensis]
MHFGAKILFTCVVIDVATLITTAASATRLVDPEFAPGLRIMFSAEYPFMLLSQESLDALNKHLKESIPINRFRPNILVEGCEPYSEDLWTEVSISKATFHGVKLCIRCKIPSTIDQDTRIAGSKPPETLTKVRSDKVLLPNRKHKGKVFFGQNLGGIVEGKHIRNESI